ncbi:MAG: hypothetical protein AAGH65_11215, partial [Pseudomonadota bacterium]
SSTSVSPAALSDAVFGTFGDSVNLKSQYLACSYDQVDFVPATGLDINDGVVMVDIDMNVNGASNGSIANEMLIAANALLGSPVHTLADHVMFAVPPGTNGNWIGYANVNGWRSVYNDGWIESVSLQMHELGHNFGRRHSNEDFNEYNDQSGMMGFSYSGNDSPIMCFNGAKSVDFRWYTDQVVTLVEQSWTLPAPSLNFDLIGIANYADATQGQDALIRVRSIPTTDDAKTLNIAYNRKVGINNGTREASNRVTVTETYSPSSFEVSNLVAKLNTGQSYVASNFWGNGKDLTVFVDDILTDQGIQFARVTLTVPQPEDVFADSFESALPGD